MRTWRRSACFVACLLVASATAAGAAGNRATVREYRKVIRTYPFSDPNPIPQPGRIYPYFRFDGYTDRPVDREWTVIELENDYLRVTILPEIGGKIWSAVEKSTGRSFIYDNHVVKFRDIALRGPWTSGGIEPNYGIIGHTPNCATPVDYTTGTTPEGATVVIGVFDLLTRTPWRLVITLPHDKAYFTTRSIWYNGSGIEQPYYSWMNTGIKAAGNLELVYPGTNYIGHGGEVFPWPIDPENGKNLAFYEQNDFGSYKSYHVLGRESDFFGAYWHDDDYGMGHYARRDDKLGKKAWIWGLSRQGMIWEKLLTDTDGQYVEVQSGRLFNQAAEQSTFTPFKHRGFEPYSTETWTEYWFPVKGTGGYVKANEHGALNVVLPGTVRPGVATQAAMVKAVALELRFSPLESVNDTLEVFDGDHVVFSARLALQPMQTWSQSIDVRVPAERLRVRIGDWFDYRPVSGDELSRPLESPKDFDWESVQGLHLKGKEWMRQREYVQAQSALEACLKKDPNYVPALADLAIVRYLAMDYLGAWTLARRALAIDTYDPASNYSYGLASAQLGRAMDAQDGFEVAAQSPEYRAAAWTELARLALSGGDVRSAEEYAARSTTADPMNAGGLQILAVAGRVGGKRAEAAAALARMVELDPLDHFARAEARSAGAPGAGRRRAQRAAARDIPRTRGLVSRHRSARRRPTRARAGAAAGRGSLLARLPAGRAARSGRGRYTAPGRRRIAASRVPVPVRERIGVRLGDWPDDQLATALLPILDPVEPRRRETRARPAHRVRRRSRLRAVLRHARKDDRVVVARRVSRRPPAGGDARSRRMALRQAAHRAVHRGPGLRTGADHGGALRGGITGELDSRPAARQDAAAQSAVHRGERRAGQAERPAPRRRDRVTRPLPRGRVDGRRRQHEGREVRCGPSPNRRRPRVARAPWRR